MMKLTFKSKNQIFGFIISCLAILFSFIFSLGSVDYKILEIVQDILGRTLRDPGRWVEIIKHCVYLFISLILGLDFLLFTKTGNEIASEIILQISKTKDGFNIKHDLQKLIFTFAFLFLVFFKIIISNFYYADDIFRNYNGDRSWIGFSRYVSEFLSILIHNNLSLNDISPLSQIISLIIMSFTVFIINKIIVDKEIKYTNIISISLVFISPFFAENISYRFDCPYMALSILFALLPFIFTYHKKTYYFVSIISLILCCISYQAALGIYIITTIFIAYKKIISSEDNKSILIFVLESAACFIIALIIFRLFYMNTISNSEDDYFSSKISIGAIIPNSINFIKLTFTLFGNLFSKFLLICLILIFLFTTFCYSKINKITTLFITVIALIISYVLSIGPYLAFEKPLFVSRSFMGFNYFICCLAVIALDFAETKLTKNISKTIIGLLAYNCIVFMFVTGNCYTNQKEYENFRMTLLLSDLSKITDHSQKYDLAVKGSIGNPEKNRVAYSNFPLLKEIIASFPKTNSSWNDEIFNGYNFNIESVDYNLDNNYIKVCENYYHRIYIEETKKTIAIELLK